MEIKWIPLHTHSTFSVLDGYGTPDQIAERAKSIGLECISLTDHGSTSGHPQFEVACKKHGIKPIYGCEFYLGKVKERKKHHITVLAKNAEGYQALLKLSNLSYLEDHFYYMPTIRLEELYEHQENLIVLSGCLYGLPAQMIVAGDIEGAERTIAEMHSNIEHFYLEIQPFELPESRIVNTELIRIAKKQGIPIVSTNDSHYVNPGEGKIQWFLGAVRRNKSVNDDHNEISPRCHIATAHNMLEWGAPIASLQNTCKIGDMIETFDLPKAEPVKFEGAGYEDLLQLSREGWVRRKIDNNDKRYVERVLYELDLIKQKGYVDYFLVVADMVRWAKSQDIMVGTARGSAAGSLIAFLTGITEVDPIKWDLLFERFIDISRTDPPDIDLDFQADRREEIKDYLAEKYGKNRVANIAGYSLFREKSLLDDIGRVFRYPKSVIEDAKERGIDVVLPNMAYLSQVEGSIRQFTVHAAGIVVASEDLGNFTTIGRNGLMLDYRDAERMGLMKIDTLSLKTLTVLNHCLKKIGKSADWLYHEVSLDDLQTYQGFQEGLCEGVFQFEGATTRQICMRIKPTTFNELIDINALSRPGPIMTGSTERYIQGIQEDIHPKVTEITKRSKGQILFQEQIMKILREIGNLSWADVTAVRKLITKKQGAEKLAGIKQKFIEGADCEQETAERIWGMCLESGEYGFNVAHSTSYTFLGYYCMYLKKHYPLEFYWANLMVEPDKQSILHEYVQQGGQIYGVKWGKSGSGWEISDGALRAGFITVKGVGPKTAEKLENGEMPKGKILRTLQMEGAFDEGENPNDLGLGRLKRMIGRHLIKDLQQGEYVRVTGIVSKISIKKIDSPEKEPHLKEYAFIELRDETGAINGMINRFKYADPIMKSIVDNCEGRIITVVGELNQQSGKIFISKMRLDK